MPCQFVHLPWWQDFDVKRFNAVAEPIATSRGSKQGNQRPEEMKPITRPKPPKIPLEENANSSMLHCAFATGISP
jgi:hypothetical protein